jgi:hypothetical protein
VKKVSSLLLLLIVFCLLRCKKDNVSDVHPSFNIPILKGFECRNEAADKYSIIGIPDIKLDDAKPGDPSGYTYSFISYPNPNLNSYNPVQVFHSMIFFSVFSKVRVNSFRFWMEKGSYGEMPDQSLQLVGAESFVGSPHIAEFTSSNLVEGYSQFATDISKLEPGYYRVFVKINDVLLWDNLIINLNPF